MCGVVRAATAALGLLPGSGHVTPPPVTACLVTARFADTHYIGRNAHTETFIAEPQPCFVGGLPGMERDAACRGTVA
jgi:hypothetical protein